MRKPTSAPQTTTLPATTTTVRWRVATADPAEPPGSGVPTTPNPVPVRQSTPRSRMRATAPTSAVTPTMSTLPVVASWAFWPST